MEKGKWKQSMSSWKQFHVLEVKLTMQITPYKISKYLNNNNIKCHTKTACPYVTDLFFELQHLFLSVLHLLRETFHLGQCWAQLTLLCLVLFLEMLGLLTLMVRQVTDPTEAFMWGYLSHHQTTRSYPFDLSYGDLQDMATILCDIPTHFVTKNDKLLSLLDECLLESLILLLQLFDFVVRSHTVSTWGGRTDN